MRLLPEFHAFSIRRSLPAGIRWSDLFLQTLVSFSRVTFWRLHCSFLAFVDKRDLLLHFSKTLSLDTCLDQVDRRNRSSPSSSGVWKNSDPDCWHKLANKGNFDCNNTYNSCVVNDFSLFTGTINIVRREDECRSLTQSERSEADRDVDEL